MPDTTKDREHDCVFGVFTSVNDGKEYVTSQKQLLRCQQLISQDKDGVYYYFELFKYCPRCGERLFFPDGIESKYGEW